MRFLMVSGSVRRGSTNVALLRTAQAQSGTVSVLYEGLTDLPHFNPDDDRIPLPVAVADLRRQVGEADAVLFSTPEYAGALPGTFKNLLDWTIGGGELYEKPAAWVNVSASPTGAADAYRSLRTVLTYATCRIAEEACVAIPVTRGHVGADGLITDPVTVAAVAAMLASLSRFVMDQRTPG
ncbi:MAG: NAD(P)H-dependent oxidoreductase [Actinomycetota bacterium]|nr:NAD(P)H-dependent oxidoreductase [Actinomycetota bacterium]